MFLKMGLPRALVPLGLNPAQPPQPATLRRRSAADLHEADCERSRPLRQCERDADMLSKKRQILVGVGPNAVQPMFSDSAIAVKSIKISSSHREIHIETHT